MAAISNVLTIAELVRLVVAVTSFNLQQVSERYGKREANNTPFRRDSSRCPFVMPGDEGPRPLLRFVVNTLNGKDGGRVRFHFFLATQSNRDLSADERAALLAEKAMITGMSVLGNMWVNSGKSRTNQRVDTPETRNTAEIPIGFEDRLADVMYRYVGDVALLRRR